MQGPLYRLKKGDSVALKRRLGKALKSQSVGLYLVYGEYEKDFEESVAIVEADRTWPLLIEVCPQALDSKLLDFCKSKGHTLVFSETLCSDLLLTALEQVKALNIPFKILLRPTKLSRCRQSLKSLPKEFYSHLYFEFSSFDPTNPESLSVKEIAGFIQQIKRDLPDLVVRPIDGLGFLNPQIPEDFELEATEKIAFEFQTGNSDILISVVIPSYNSKYFLCNVLRHLSMQSLDKEKYEIIVVDDGSNDDGANFIENLFSHQHSSINMKYLYWPRAKPRTRGDHFFRAGLARNLGVRHARGEMISFLDSDMLVDEDFLERVTGLLKKHDLVQAARHHLHTQHSSSYSNYKETTPDFLYIEEKSYWGPFFQTENWQSLPYFWKFTCTYCLSIKKSDFYQLGRFYRNFVSYGFEDTHLGYRFAKAGKKFYLDKVPALHLTAYSHSEYRSSEMIRFSLLEKTAKIFFLNTLDLDVFQHFRSFLRMEKGVLSKLKEVFLRPSAE